MVAMECDDLEGHSWTNIVSPFRESAFWIAGSWFSANEMIYLSKLTLVKLRALRYTKIVHYKLYTSPLLSLLLSVTLTSSLLLDAILPFSCVIYGNYNIRTVSLHH